MATAQGHLPGLDIVPPTMVRNLGKESNKTEMGIQDEQKPYLTPSTSPVNCEQQRIFMYKELTAAAFVY